MTNKGPLYYDGFFNNVTGKSDKNNKTYDTIYPLNTSSPDTKLRFSPWNPCVDGQKIVVGVADGKIPPISQSCVQIPEDKGPQLVFRGYLGPGNQDAQTALTIFGDTLPPPQNPNNFFAPYSTDNIKLQSYVLDPPPGGPRVGSWHLTHGKHPLNLQFDGYAWNWAYSLGKNILCNGTQYNRIDVLDADTADFNSPSCKWRTDQEAFGCCTALRGDWQSKSPYDSSKTVLESQCAPAFMPDGAPGSICPQLMLNICENDWKAGPCQQYLQSFTNNADVGNVVQTIVRNYINGQAERTGCGSNLYTTPNLKWKCKKPDGTYRDDSKDDFLKSTLPYLCTAGKTGQQPGFCDLILNQYCAPFTRQDLINDSTLQQMCGCHLSGGTGSRATQGGLTNLGNQPPAKNQYPYPGITTACDPICNYDATIPYGSQTCSDTVCIMDNVNINEINSKSGKITINQVCKGAKEGKSSCYISDIDINIINSQTGGVVLKQGCDACYAFCPSENWDQNAPAGAVKVDCGNPAASYSPNMCKGGGSPTGPGNGGGNGGAGNGGNGNGGTDPRDDGGTFDSAKDWIEEHPYWSLAGGVTLFLLLVVIITLLYVHFSGD